MHTHTHGQTQTNRQTNEIMARSTYPGTSEEIHEARWPATLSRPRAFKE